MIRADAAGLLARADLFYARRPKASRLKASDQTYIKFEPWLRLAVPALIGLFVVALSATLIIILLDAHDRAIAAAVDDLELVAAATASDLAGLAKASDRDPSVALLHALPARALTRGRRIFISNKKGNIVAALPNALHHGGALADCPRQRAVVDESGGTRWCSACPSRRRHGCTGDCAYVASAVRPDRFCASDERRAG